MRLGPVRRLHGPSVAGQAVRSCQTPVSAATKAPVYHPGGALAGRLPSAAAAWIELDVPQCGYCQAGQIMNAAALLAKTPRPTDQDIDSAMQGTVPLRNLSAHSQAIHMAATLADSSRRRP